MKQVKINYGVLGLLAFKPWSAYELIQEMKRNFHYFYPRAESGLYEELKKLEKLGYLSSEIETKNKKERNVYQITDEGKKALQAWHATEPSPFNLEFDGLLRIFLAKFGNDDTLTNVLQKTQEDAGVLSQLAEKIGNEYLSDKAPAQSEILQRVIVFDFLLHYGILYKYWVSRTEAYLSQIENLSEQDAEVIAKAHIKNAMLKFGFEIGNK